ncbi:MAG: amino acid adenylation domain-containing protein [Trichormus sp. ATA11-4-KO1]|jgi:amino acid adenylation domain-containing protein|nr:amino acid adenylation domain-containing protein [Trichormus sp. ATA11-4-KO1]
MQKQQISGFRLSPQQKHLWLLQQNDLTAPYRVQCAVLITEKLKTDVLKTALQNVVNQYEILRTTFSFLPGMEIPLQVIVDNYNISLTEFNFTDLSWQEQESKIESLLTEIKTVHFNLENNPPFQAYIVSLSSEKYILILNLSALIADSSTLKYLINKISTSYSACLQGQDISNEPIQYADIAEWQNELLDSEESELGKEYWRKQDITSIDNLHLWFENQQIETSEFQPQCISLTINNDLVKQIESLTHIYNVNKCDFLLACWLIMLWKITRQPDMFIGVASDGRKYEELDQALGLLTKYLPLCFHLEAEFKFSEILKQVTESANNAYEWQEYFTWEETFKSEAFCPFSFEFAENYSVADLSFSLYKQYSCIDKFKINLICIDKSDSLITELHFDANLYNTQDIQTLSEQFKTLLEDAIANPEATISQLNILSDRTLQKILVEFNNTTVDYPSNKCLHQLFEEQVARTPEQIAVIFEQQQLTYTQLNARANQLAHYLRQHGVGSEVVVALYMERSLELIIGLLAILKAGGAYIPLDPAYPQERLAWMLADAKVPILLTQQQLVKTLPEHSAQVICWDQEEDAIAHQSQENPHSSVNPENLVYVLFTSGSTGKPKGVAVEHRQLSNYLNAIVQTLDLSGCNSFAHISTFAADLGNTIIFPSLCTGGCLHIVSSERISNPEALADYFHQHPIDCLKIVPAHLAALMTASQPEKILPRQRLILGGEACNWQLIEQIQQLTTECRIFNHYGPTETTVGVLTYPIEPGKTPLNSNTVPIGRPIPNTQIYILDSCLQPVPIGVPGELHIGGASVTRGYLNHPDLTNQKFITNPFIKTGCLYKTGDLARYLPDGNIEFLGRIDQQVKIRGYRIELGEIEIVLKQHPSMREAVVICHEEQTGNKRLIAYVVVKTQSALNNTHLREFLQEKLPQYMLPSVFMQLQALPLLPNGKINRQALPVPDTSKAEFAVAPRTQVEEVLAGIWADILELPQVGIYDNFFEVGGDSILSIRIVAKANQAGLQLTPKQMFEYQTIAELAAVVQVNQEKQLEEEIPLTPPQPPSHNSASYTPSDFPQANLNQKDLDNFLTKLNQKK